ncbi:hypothetical protein LINPERHAP1_LOCUS24474 [Linum perenne]
MNGLQGNKSLLFGITAWTIWKDRNEFIFSNSSASAVQTTQRSIRSTNTVTEAFQREARCFGTPRPKSWVDIAWEPGPTDWVTINTDGSFTPAIRKASVGGIIRTSDGRGLVAFTMNLGMCTITRAEIRGAITGLDEANKAADFLANHGYNFPFGIHLYTLSDCNLGHILSISEPCLIPVIN